MVSSNIFHYMLVMKIFLQHWLVLKRKKPQEAFAYAVLASEALGYSVICQALRR